MLDYKNIIVKRYALGLSLKELADEFNASKSGVGDFLKAFEACENISYPLPAGITNYAIGEIVYGHAPGENRKSLSYEQPDFEHVFQQMSTRNNMTLIYLWNRYKNDCEAREVKPYQYRQFCDLYSKWCEENYETLRQSGSRRYQDGLRHRRRAGKYPGACIHSYPGTGKHHARHH